MADKQRRGKERAAGIGGSVLAAPWVFLGVLHIVDGIGRAETLMTITPYLGIFATPVAFLIEVIGGVGLLFYATRLEQGREADETPRIIRPWSEPEKPKRHWFWIKLGVTSAVISILAALSVSLSIRYSHKKATRVVVKSQDTPATVALPVSLPPPNREPKTSPKKTDFAIVGDPPRRSDQPSVAAPSVNRTPVVIPVPDISRSPSKEPMRKEVGQTIAIIGDSTVKAGDKPPGKLYVSLSLSAVSKYRGDADEKTVEAVRAALDGTGRLVVFPRVSAYDIGTPTSSQKFGIGSLGSGNAKGIAYFDDALKDSCTAIQKLISDIIMATMSCEGVPLPALLTGPNDLNLQRDFRLASGLDLEIIL